ncbi:hypothetical protein BDN70DRAFT_623161 [Pholiota conissans]|uniref:Uncharacterized protein n=1 Tax=Pholiota conissans TaxID=109636 RepID=A0A9P5Z3T5_9AGAR|nr:hypothetical protein BDN70DRAFT_623161 [Pholiota conissans]
MSNSNLPPLGSDHVFSVSSSALIDAPLEKVWAIMLDFPNYTKWNSFVRKMTMVSPSKVPLPDQTPVVGEHITINVNMPPTMDEPGLFGTNTAFCVITHIDGENYRVSWKTAGVPYFLLHTERWQALSIDEATGKTKYETVEAFGGILAYITSFFFGDKLRVSFKAAADTLKAHAEQPGQ